MSAEDELKDVRLKKLDQMRLEEEPLYPNRFRRNTTAEVVQERFRETSSEDLERVEESFALAAVVRISSTCSVFRGILSVSRCWRIF